MSLVPVTLRSVPAGCTSSPPTLSDSSTMRPATAASPAMLAPASAPSSGPASARSRCTSSIMFGPRLKPLLPAAVNDPRTTDVVSKLISRLAATSPPSSPSCTARARRRTHRSQPRADRDRFAAAHGVREHAREHAVVCGVAGRDRAVRTGRLGHARVVIAAGVVAGIDRHLRVGRAPRRWPASTLHAGVVCERRRREPMRPACGARRRRPVRTRAADSARAPSQRGASSTCSRARARSAAGPDG